MTNDDWMVGDRFANLSTPWFTLIGEHIQTGEQTLDYWRIEKADSVIVLPIQASATEQAPQQLLLPPAMYRPGLQTKTLDFPGGRCPKGRDPSEAAYRILQRELGIEHSAVASLTGLNPEGWPVNSSFSDQKLYGFVAQVHPAPNPGSSYPINKAGINRLLSQLNCLQCRMVLLEWWHRA